MDYFLDKQKACKDSLLPLQALLLSFNQYRLSLKEVFQKNSHYNISSLLSDGTARNCKATVNI